jgi:hypothetical protein
MKKQRERLQTMEDWMVRYIVLFAAACLLAAGGAWARYTFFSPAGSYSVEVSLENPPEGKLRLPIYRNRITSLAALGDWAIGGTSARKGLSPYLFAVSLTERELKVALDLAEVVPGQREIHSGFGRVGDVLYAGTVADSEGEGGHLLRIEFDGAAFAVDDLGVPVAGRGVFALTADPDRGHLYGITYPDGSFFRYDISTTNVELFEETAITDRQHSHYHHYGLKHRDVLSRALLVDGEGRVWGSRPVNRIFFYDPAAGKLVTIEEELPTVWGRRPLGRADSWALAPDGTIYGGNAGDGQLFRIDPNTMQVSNLGKPIMSPRMTGIAFGGDGRLYGVAGFRPGYGHLFVYDTARHDFIDLGNPRFDLHVPDVAESLAWRGYQIATVAATEDGSHILLGEDEALSQLMVFPVDAAPEHQWP